jgi:ABC-type multidrug transport system permease subunit
MPDSEPKIWPPLAELTRARMLEFIRQGEAVFWTFMFPVLMALALGIAFRNSGPEKIVVAVEENGPRSAAVAAALEEDPQMLVRRLSPTEAVVALRTGRVTLAVEPGDGPAGNTYRFDPSRPESRLARLAVDDALQKASGRKDVVPAQEVKVTEQGSRYIDFLIPGLLGMNLMGSGMWGLGFAVVQARTRGLLKRLVATPMRRSHYLLSYMFSRLLFLILEVAIIVGFGRMMFGVRVHGSLLTLGLIALLGALAFAGIGVLVAARPTSIEGVSGLMNLVMLPMWLLSGTFFSYERFPDFAHPFIKALPLTALNDALRAAINEGSGLTAHWGPLAVMLAWGLASFVVALRIFRWQ